MNPPLIFITSHKMQRLPWICTLPPLDAVLTMRFTKNTQHDSSKVLRLPRKMTMEVSKVLCLPRKMHLVFWKRCESIAPITQNDFRHVVKHVGMSRSATPATRNKVTQRLKPPKVTTFAALPQTRTLLYTFGKSVSWVGTATNQRNTLLSWSSCCNLTKCIQRYPITPVGKIQWTNGVHRILSGRLIRIKKHLQCEAEVVGSCATRQKKTSGWSLQGRKSSVFHKDLLSPSERK